MSLNGDLAKVEIDVTDDTAFKVGLVQTLQLLADRTACLSEVKKKVDKHEQIVQIGKYASVPILGLVHISLKTLLHKLGWG